MDMLTSMIRLNKSFAWVAVLGVVTGFSGCESQPMTGSQTEESHEHFPAHWPYTISRASTRLAELIKDPNATSDEHAIAPRDEFVDLVNWLPILAADSDLDRPTFDRIDAWSTRSVSQWQRAGSPRELKDLVEEPETQEMVAWLVDICKQEDSRLEQLK
jgi:hypothetical protein